jgi:hypothetical protein
VTALERAFDGYFRRGERYALIFDTRPVMVLPDAKCRKALAAWVNSPKVRMNTVLLNVGSALVVASQIARYGITVVGWLYKHPTPQVAVSSMGEAVEWSCRRLEEAGVPLGAHLAELRAATKHVA